MSHMNPIKKMVSSTRTSKVKWKLFYTNWCIGIFLSDFIKWRWFYALTDDGSRHNIDVDSSLFIVEVEKTKEQYSLWVVDNPDRIVSIDNIWFFLDIFRVELTIKIPNLKNLCAEFLSEKHRLSRDTSKSPERDEPTGWGVSIDELTGSPTRISSEISLTQSMDETSRQPQQGFTQQLNDTSSDSSPQLAQSIPYWITLNEELVARATSQLNNSSVRFQPSVDTSDIGS